MPSKTSLLSITLKQVFSDAIDSAIDFIKNPGKHIKEAAGNIWDGVKIYPVKH